MPLRKEGEPVSKGEVSPKKGSRRVKPWLPGGYRMWLLVADVWGAHTTAARTLWETISSTPWIRVTGIPWEMLRKPEGLEGNFVGKEVSRMPPGKEGDGSWRETLGDWAEQARNEGDHDGAGWLGSMAEGNGSHLPSENEGGGEGN